MSPALVTVCQTDILGEGRVGCGVTFPYKTQHGLCPKCLHLRTLNGDGKRYAWFANLPACVGCGRPYEYLKGQLCGGCKLKAGPVDIDKQSIAQERQTEAADQLPTATHAQIPNSGAPNRYSLNQDQASQTLQRAVSPRYNTLSNSVVRQSLSGSNQPIHRESTITVYMAFRVGRYITTGHAYSIQSYSENTLLVDIQRSAVDFLNESTWYGVANHPEPLVLEDTFLRWHQNIHLPCNVNVTTLGELDRFYYEHPQATLFYANLPKFLRNWRGKVVPLELFIDNGLYKKRIAGYLNDVDEVY